MKVNLANVMRNRVNCYGYLYRFSNGKYGYQNDNDLGLDLDEINAIVNVKKVKCSKGYAFIIRNDRNCVPEDDGNGVSLKLALALLHECHSFKDKMSEKEEKLCKKYWEKA